MARHVHLYKRLHNLVRTCFLNLGLCYLLLLLLLLLLLILLVVVVVPPPFKGAEGWLGLLGN